MARTFARLDFGYCAYSCRLLLPVMGAMELLGTSMDRLEGRSFLGICMPRILVHPSWHL